MDERLPDLLAIVRTLLDDGITTPEAMAKVLDETLDKKARKYSEAVWDVFGVMHKNLRGTHQWVDIYAEIDRRPHAINPSNELLDKALSAFIALNETPNSSKTKAPAKLDDHAVNQCDGQLDGEVETVLDDDHDECDEADRDDADDSEEDEDPDSPEAITRWAEGIGEQIATFQELLEAAGVRAGLNPDLMDAIKEMKAGLTAMIEGELPSDSWRLELTLSQGMSDGSSHGTRNYAISVDEEGLRAVCYGTEWQRGEGSDSWTGATFSYRPTYSKEESGYFYEFTNEFEDAVRSANYVLSVEFKGESIGQLPEIVSSHAEGERLATGFILRLVADLQGMPYTLSGDDSVLKNVWDEICAQKQIEMSFCWDVYEATLRGLIEGTVEAMLHDGKVVLWLLTEEGVSWRIDREDEHKTPIPCDQDISNFIYDRLMHLASDYLNHRIISYRDRSSD